MKPGASVLLKYIKDGWRIKGEEGALLAPEAAVLCRNGSWMCTRPFRRLMIILV